VERPRAWNGLEERFDIRTGDFRDRAILQTEERFDLVLGSPPYFPSGSGVEGDHPQKIACRFELRGTIADYCEVAARHLENGGWFACVFPMAPSAQEHRVKESASAAGLSIVRTRPVILREGERPLLSLFGMMRAKDLPRQMREQTWTEPPLIIRRTDGGVHPEYSAIKLSFGFPP
jgi:tRNA1Val (adenine37-N6)-methyltransferase